MSQVGVLSVPLIMIQPSDYQKILSNESRIFEMGPHGFVKQGVDDFLDGSYVPGVQRIGLPTQTTMTYYENYTDCTDGMGALVSTTKQDTNSNGIYETSEITVLVECMSQSPYTPTDLGIKCEGIY